MARTELDERIGLEITAASDAMLRAVGDCANGKTVLEIGGYNGALSGKLVEKGAKSSVVVDNCEWRQYGWPEPTMPEGIELISLDFMDYQIPADVVIFSNVIYHCKDPFAAIAKVRSLTKETLIIRTSFVLYSYDGSGWGWYPDGSGHSNMTVWCRPTMRGLEKALRDGGFSKIKFINKLYDHVIYRCA